MTKTSEGDRQQKLIRARRRREHESVLKPTLAASRMDNSSNEGGLLQRRYMPSLNRMTVNDSSSSDDFHEKAEMENRSDLSCTSDLCRVPIHSTDSVDEQAGQSHLHLVERRERSDGESPPPGWVQHMPQPTIQLASS